MHSRVHFTETSYLPAKQNHPLSLELSYCSPLLHTASNFLNQQFADVLIIKVFRRRERRQAEHADVENQESLSSQRYLFILVAPW